MAHRFCLQRRVAQRPFPRWQRVSLVKHVVANVRSTVFVEAELEMRAGGNATDGTPLPDRPLLRHRGSTDWERS